MRHVHPPPPAAAGGRVSQTASVLPSVEAATNRRSAQHARVLRAGDRWPRQVRAQGSDLRGRSPDNPAVCDRSGSLSELGPLHVAAWPASGAGGSARAGTPAQQRSGEGEWGRAPSQQQRPCSAEQNALAHRAHAVDRAVPHVGLRRAPSGTGEPQQRQGWGQRQSGSGRRRRRSQLKQSLSFLANASLVHNRNISRVQKLRLGGDALGADPAYLLYLPSRPRGGLRRIDFGAWPRATTLPPTIFPRIGPQASAARTPAAFAGPEASTWR